MTTFSAMQTRIADDITRSDLTTQIANAINDAIKTWEGVRFAFNEKRYLIRTVPSQEYYDLSGSGLLNFDASVTDTGEMVLEIDSITNTVSNFPYPLRERTQQWFDRYQSLPSQYTGQPDSYGIYGNQLRLFPIPDGSGPEVDGAYNIRISALARLGPNPLGEADDTNAWMTEGEILIRNQALVSLYRHPLKDAESKAVAQEAVDEQFLSLTRKRDAKAGTGTISPWRG